MLEQADTSSSRAAPPSISAVVPMFQEGTHAAAFLAALRDQLASLTERFEIVVVNDGSRDSTREEVLRVATSCAVHYLELSRNFGKEAAITAGLEAARGDVVVLLDGDGQHPVDVIPAMLERWRRGDDMVYGVRSHRRDEGRPGGLISMAALTYGAWVVVDELVYDIPIPGYPTLVVSIMFFSGVQLLSLGVLGEYLGRVFEEVKGRPTFIVADRADHSSLHAGRGDTCA